MASFSKAFEFTMKNEGGWSNDANDKGGMTNYGISESIYSFFLNRKATENDMRAIDLNTAKDVYRKFFWQPMCLDMVVYDSVATAIFDQAVNRGVPKVAEDVQRMCGIIPVDGIIGKKSLDKINAEDPIQLVKNIANLADMEYRMIVSGDETQKRFLDGWLARSQRIRELV